MKKLVRKAVDSVFVRHPYNMYINVNQLTLTGAEDAPNRQVSHMGAKYQLRQQKCPANQGTRGGT